ncbi:hypothetical protein [Sinorhizobium medicae]|nr:hypothetical protein [Sinorhizobium medicae]
MRQVYETDGTLAVSPHLALCAVAGNIAMKRIIKIEHEEIGIVSRQPYQPAGPAVQAALQTGHGKFRRMNRPRHQTRRFRLPEKHTHLLFGDHSEAHVQLPARATGGLRA